MLWRYVVQRGSILLARTRTPGKVDAGDFDLIADAHIEHDLNWLYNAKLYLAS